MLDRACVGSDHASYVRVDQHLQIKKSDRKHVAALRSQAFHMVPSLSLCSGDSLYTPFHMIC